SKDAGVRFNNALTNFVYDVKTLTWILNQGRFTTRTSLPERDSIIYEIRCSKDSITGPANTVNWLEVPWEVYRLANFEDFTDTQSFIQKNCLRLDVAKGSFKRSEEPMFHHYHDRSTSNGNIHTSIKEEYNSSVNKSTHLNSA